LHQESGLLVDEVGQRLRIADRWWSAEKLEKPQASLRFTRGIVSPDRAPSEL
jgi:hypothetical protein